VLLCLPARGQELFTCPVLPREGQAFEIIYRADGTSGPRTAAFTVRQRNGVLVARRSVALVEEAGALQGSLKLAVPKNGLLRATVLCGESTAETVVPVISAKREVNLIYYGMDSRLLEQGLVRWVTLATSCDPAAAAALRRRGAKPLRWNWGGNYLGERRKQLEATGVELTPDLARRISRDLYTADAAQVVREGYAGFGLDEFGDYPGSPWSEETKAFVRGIIDARAALPDGFTIAAWHAGAIGPELMGLYKQAVEFLLLESYMLEIVPSQLGTELLTKDLEGRLGDARSADMFTAPYGSRCRVIPTVDVTDTIPVGDYERYFRMVRREFPEVRGIGFFNVLSTGKWERYTVIDRLCFEYYIRPVVTLQPDSLYLDRLGSGKVTADLSNVGAIDSGPVTVRLLVDGAEAGRVTVACVPAGFSRVDNRASVRFGWRAHGAGTYRLRAEITDAPGDTVLDPATETSVFISGG
jgi:hypothetical protein